MRFESFDVDASGQLTPIEFTRLPGFYGAAEFFGELDRDLSNTVSREEWNRGAPDERGVRGLAKDAAMRGAKRGVAPSTSPHSASMPRQKVGDPIGETGSTPRSKWPALTGGADNEKRGVPRMPPPAQKDEPPPLEVAPRRR